MPTVDNRGYPRSGSHSGNSGPVTDEGLSSGSNNTVAREVAGTTGSVWSREERKQLDEALARYPADKFAPGERYMHLAALLPYRTARDVALRIKWLHQHPTHHKAHLPKAAAVWEAPVQLITPASASVQALPAGTAERVSLPTVSSVLTATVRDPSPSDVATDVHDPFVSALAVAVNLDNTTHETSYQAHDGGDPEMTPINQLMTSNYTILQDFKTNMAVCKVTENTELLVDYKDNLVSLMDRLQQLTATGHLALTPPLSVQPNLELFNSLLASAAPSYPHASASGPGTIFQQLPQQQQLQQPFNSFLTAGGNPMSLNSILPMSGGACMGGSLSLLPAGFILGDVVQNVLNNAMFTGSCEPCPLGDLDFALFLPHEEEKATALRAAGGQQEAGRSNQSTNICGDDLKM